MPAILKGFIDRVFTSRFAFEYFEMPIVSKILNQKVPRALLKGKKAVVFTTIGAKKWQEFIVMAYRFKHLMSNDILRYCGIKNKFFTLDKCTSDCKLRDKEIKKLVKKGLNYLFN